MNLDEKVSSVPDGTEKKTKILMYSVGKDFAERGDLFRIFLSIAKGRLTGEQIYDTMQDFIVSMGTGGHTYHHEVYEGMRLNEKPIFSWLLSCWRNQISATLKKKEREIPKFAGDRNSSERKKVIRIDGNHIIQKSIAYGNCYRISGSRIEEEDGNEKEKDYSRLYGALRGLTSEQREVIELHYFQGLQIKGIAQRLRLNEETINGRLYCARRYLRDVLRERDI